MLHVLYETEGRPQAFALSKDEVTLGRSNENDIVLNDFSVSRRHAVLRKEGDDWVIHDCKSTNGLRVNDKPLESARVADGDMAQIGTFALQFREKVAEPAHVSPKAEAMPYQLLEEIGHGGSARVYSARRPDGSLIAVKIFDLGKRSGSAGTIYDFFKNELAVVRSLNHPNIVKYLDAGVSEGVPYIAMELLNGGSLEDKVRVGAFLAVDDVIGIVTPIASALDYAREHHVLHRDIKPSNILFADDGRPVLSDFGIARFAPPREATTAAVGAGPPGTSDFMAPEVMLEAPATPASDIYSLGMTVYYCLCGDLPTDGKTPFTRSRDRVEGKLVSLSERNPSIPGSVADAVLRALSPNPRDRFATARAFAGALTVASADGARASSPSKASKVERATGKGRRWFAYWRYVLVPLLIALIGALAAWLGAKK